MKKLPPQIMAAFRQQLEADRWLGVRTVPLNSDTIERLIRPDRPPPPSPRRIADAQQRLRVLDEQHVKGCTKCGLHRSRKNTVFGQGNPVARLVFVGEGPGADEDRQGLAFVGRAGGLLTRMIENGMGLKRDDVFICNVVKCRPPENRTPTAEEILACSPYLREQLAIIQPEVVVALGAPAAKTLLNTSDSIGSLRGRFHDYRISTDADTVMTVPLMPTYHPAYLLRNPEDKRKTWTDLQMVMDLLGLPLPSR